MENRKDYEKGSKEKEVKKNPQWGEKSSDKACKEKSCKDKEKSCEDKSCRENSCRDCKCCS